MAAFDHFQPCRTQPAADLGIVEAKAKMRVAQAKFLTVVRCEVDDKNAARTGNPRCLGDDRTRRVGEVEDLMQHNGVGAAIGPRKGVHVGMPDLGVGKAGRLDTPARQPQHLRRPVDTDGRHCGRTEQFDHSPGARADVEQPADRTVAEQVDDRRLDLGLGDMERADTVPIGGMNGEIGGSDGGAFGTDRRQPRAVGVAAVPECIEQPQNRPDMCRVTEANEDPRAFLGAPDQTGIAEDLEVTRHPWLALPEHLGQLADGQLHVPHEIDDPQAGWIGESTQGLKQ